MRCRRRVDGVFADAVVPARRRRRPQHALDRPEVQAGLLVDRAELRERRAEPTHVVGPRVEQETLDGLDLALVGRELHAVLNREGGHNGKEVFAALTQRRERQHRGL